MDSYIQSFRLIPNVGISIKRLEQAASSMEKVEARRVQLNPEITQANWKSVETVEKIQQYSSYVETITPQRQKASSQVDETLAEVKEQSENLKNKIAKAKEELGYLEPSRVPNLSCENITKVIEAAAPCMMFTRQAAGKVLSGNLLTVGGAATSLITTVHTAQGDVSRDQIMGRFRSIEPKLEGKELKAIGDLAEGVDGKFMKVGMVSKAKFDALVDANFPGDASAGAREVRDRMVAQAQVINKALIEHQKALLNQAKVEAFFVQAKLAKDFASGDTSAVVTVKSQLFWQLYDESYAQQKAGVMKYYLGVIRAIVAIKLEPTSIPRSR